MVQDQACGAKEVADEQVLPAGTLNNAGGMGQLGEMGGKLNM